MNEHSFASGGSTAEAVSGAEDVTSVEEIPAMSMETPDAIREIETEAPGFFSKLRNAGKSAVEFFSNEEARKQVAETVVGVVASVAGVKAFNDVPKYLHQRFMVRGMDFGPLGKGSGMSGSVERLLSANAEMRDGFEDGLSGGGDAEGGSHAVRDAINDLNERLALTKEGEQKGSEQRKMIAKLLMENRMRERMSAEARGERMQEILDDYTTTKVTGMTAARETLNTVCVATGAMGLRTIGYGMMDGIARYQRLSKEAGEEGESPDILRDVILGGINETLEAAALRNTDGKSNLRSGLDAVQAYGKIFRYVGIGAGVVGNPEGLEHNIDKLVDGFSGKLSAADVAQNFEGNIEHTIQGFERMAQMVNPFHSTEAVAAEFVSLPGHSGVVAGESELTHEAPVVAQESAADIAPIVEVPHSAPEMPLSAAGHIDTEGNVSSSMLRDPNIGFDDKADAIRLNIAQNGGQSYDLAGERFSVRSADGVLLGPDGKELTPESLAKFVPTETPAPVVAQESAADIAPIVEVPHSAPEMPLSAAGHIDTEGNVSSSMLRDPNIGFDDKADAIRLNIAQNGGQSYDLAGERFSVRSADGVLLGPDGKELTPESLAKFVPTETPAPVVAQESAADIAPIVEVPHSAPEMPLSAAGHIDTEGNVSSSMLRDPNIGFDDKADAIRLNIAQNGGQSYDLAGERFSVRSADGVLLGPDGKPFTEDSLRKFFPEQAPAPVAEAPASEPATPVELPKAAPGRARSALADAFKRLFGGAR